MKKIIALAVATAISAPAMADLTIGGSARYQLNNGADNVGANRVLVAVSGSSTAESGVFISAGATLQLDANAAAGNTATVDGDNAVTIGNAMANVKLGHHEAGGVYSKGTDAFRVGTSPQDRVNGRDEQNYTINLTAVEGMTAAYSGSFANTGKSLRLGYDFGMFAVAAGLDDAGDSAGVDSTQLKVTADLGDVVVSVSHSDQDTGDWTNLNASFMGFNVAVEDQNGVDAVYGHYAIANPAGLDGLTVTVGAGSADGVDNSYGVRLDYAF